MKLQSKLWTSAGMILLFFWASLTMANVPGKINYQGYLTDSMGSAVADGTYSITFSIYDSASTLLWSEVQTTVEVADGIFSVHIGQDPLGNPFPEFYGNMYLGVKVGSDPEMTPRQLITTVPFAFKAADSERLGGAEPSEFSISTHSHALEDLSGNVTDAQVPDNITIQHAEHANTADNALNATHADTADTAVNAKHADEAAHALNADHANASDTAVTATKATNADNATYAASAGNADTVDGYHANSLSKTSHWHYYLNASDGSPSMPLYVDSAGEVGINTTTPARSLDIEGTARVMSADVSVDMNLYQVSQVGSLWFSNQYGFKSIVDQARNYNYGVYGSAEGGSLANYALYGTTSASAGAYATYGIARNSGNYVTYGGHFTSLAERGVGVRGYASYGGTSSTAESYGGLFESRSRRGTGVKGIVSYSGSGLKYAGYFECDSETGYGVYATVNGDYTNWAFRGEATGSGSNGAWFSTVGEDTTAVYGYAGGSTGTYNSNKGGSFYAYGNHGYGVYARAEGQYGTGIYASGGSDGYAGIFRGNVKITRESDGATVMELGEGLDYAEGFDVKRPKLIEPGTVLIIDPESPGRLCMSEKAYDTKVAGIVAGADGLGSGVRLGAGRFDHDVALAGRVYCKVDAAETGIKLGDLLTTADRPGYAMRASDRDRSRGAILGKAMEPLEKGSQGKILVLVTLQ